MRLATVLLGSLLTLSASAFAQTQDTGSVEHESDRVESSDTGQISVPKGLSEVNRERKTWFFTGGLGFAPWSVSTGSVGFFADRNNLLEFTYMHHKRDDTDSGEQDYIYELGYRHFVGNSFNLSLTASERETSFKETGYTPFSGSFDTSGWAHARQGLATIGAKLGNFWQFDGLLIGCDWVGFHKAFVTHRKTRFTGSADQIGLDDEIDDDMNDARNSRLELLRFFVGWAF